MQAQMVTVASASRTWLGKDLKTKGVEIALRPISSDCHGIVMAQGFGDMDVYDEDCLVSRAPCPNLAGLPHSHYF
jgi:hypothetical protein